MLSSHNGTDANPKLLESKLANSPEFFCEVIQLLYRSEKEEATTKETSEKAIAIAEKAWRLLTEWETPPGTDDAGTFNVEHFNQWLERVKTLCSESGHWNAAQTKIGNVLIHAPADPNGLWIHQAVATVLDGIDTEDMREGFRIGRFNLRGAYTVDPSGAPETKLAEQCNREAEELENAGFCRFAVTLKDLARHYKQMAERVIDEYKREE